MRVYELIKKLEGYDPDCQVLIRVRDDDIYNHIEMTSLSRANPIIDVAKASMMAAVSVPFASNMKPDLSISISESFNSSKAQFTVDIPHADVIENIMKANERTMLRNLELARDIERRRHNYEK